MAIRITRRLCKWRPDAHYQVQSGGMIVGITLALALVTLFCTTILRSLVQAQSAAAAHREIVTARVAAEGVIRIVRGLYAAHAQQIRHACVVEKETLSLSLSNPLESALTALLPGSRITTTTYYLSDQNCIIANIQILNKDSVPFICLTSYLDSV